MSLEFSQRRAVLGGLMAAALLAGGPAAAGIEDGASAFLKSLAEKAVTSLTGADAPRPERIERFRAMFRENFAVRSIGKFVLGRNWRRASKSERREFLALFEDLMVMTYVDRFQRYAGEALEVTRSRAENDSVATVFSEIKRPRGAKPIRIEWRVGTNGAVYKILDVIVEGASMSNTLRSDFGSILRREGNRISGLLAALREKTGALKAE